MDAIEQIQAIANIRKFVEVLKEDDRKTVDKEYVVKTLSDILRIKQKHEPVHIQPFDGIEPVSDANMTFLIGEIEATYDEVVAVFGEPHVEGSGDDKIQVEWKFAFNDTGDIFTIYDWKENDKPEDVTNWHIGGHEKATMERVEEYFSEKSALLS